MKILLTGANGFLGRYVNDYFLNQKIEVVKIGKSNQNDIICDFSIEVPKLLTSTFNLVVHLAGKAHFTPVNKEQAQTFYDINVLGTKNLLEGIGNLPSKPKAFVYIQAKR